MGLIKDAFSLIASPFTSSSAEPEPREPNQPATRPSTQRRLEGQNSIVVLVVGRSGTGKTSLINTICSTNPSGITPRYPSTTEVVTYRTELFETKFKLIDTPGFDNIGLSDIGVCSKIAEYFWDDRRYGLGVNGIIYIHQAGDSLRTRSLRRYLTMLSRVFLGAAGMHRLTIFIPRVDPQGLGAAQINEELQDSNCILNQVSNMGARVASGELEAFTNIVKSYKSIGPTVLPIQDYNPNLAFHLESILHEKPIRSHSSNQDARLRNYQLKLEELQSALATKESQLVQLKNAYDQIKHIHANQKDVEATLHQRLQQTQREYASLRSELQLQENFEQGEIVQELEDLNRQIDDISRSVSAHLTDNYVRAAFEKEPSEVTALDARNRLGLFKLLGCDEGECSLISSVEGEGLDIESFFDFTIRDMLCTLLVTAIFQPFHPAIDSEQSNALLRAYDDIQKRESQTRSGKWRSSTFKSIYKDNNPDQVATWINELLHRFIHRYLIPLITCVFGSKHAMVKQHFNQMHELVTRAWNWNSKLKGEVIILGDFRQTMHILHSKFDPNTMKDFEPQPSTQPTYVLGTVALGLVSLRALGGEQPPEETLICKATVVTDSLYANARSA